jgi:hypothetical protein
MTGLIGAEITSSCCLFTRLAPPEPARSLRTTPKTTAREFSSNQGPRGHQQRQP